MRFANPAALALGLLAIPIVALHMLRPRRPSVDVSSTYLWREVSRPVSSAVPWQPLRWSALLVLQLLAVALLTVAAARPVRPTPVPLAQHTVFVVDTSASMGATDTPPDRVARAAEIARQLRRQVPDGGLASLVVASDHPRVALAQSADPREFDRAVDALRPGLGRADFATAFLLAESLETPGVPIGFVFLSDGILNSAEQRLIPPGTRYEPVGASGENQAVIGLAVEQTGSALRARVAVRNGGDTESVRQLRVDVDGRTRARVELTIPPRDTVERAFDLPAGDLVSAGLDGVDLLAVDDRAYAVASGRPSIRVLLAGENGPFWRTALEAIPGVAVERAEGTAPAPGFDLAVYDGVAVPPDPGAPFVAVAPPGGLPQVDVTGTVEGPVPTLVRSDHPLLEGLDLSDVAIAEAQRLTVAADEVLVGAEQTPLLVRGTRGGRPFAYLGFRADRSNLPVQVVFPILVDRLVTDLTRTGATTEIAAGSPLPLDTTVEATVRGPAGIERVVAAGSTPPVAERPGFWRIEQQGRPDLVFAVNPVSEEATIAPARELAIRPAVRREGDRVPQGERSVLPWVVALLGAVLAAELLLSRRTSGVPGWQWRAALGVRTAIALLLLLAIVSPTLPRPGRGVATVFVVDASDSMGAGGRAAATEWVREALREQPDGARAGVILFGGDARLELAMQTGAELLQPAAQVDVQRTNLARALRLAGAVLPQDARRRVVIVSDGEQNEGDAVAEARRLERSGVRVDVVSVPRATGADTAISDLDHPSRAAVGERYELRAAVTSSVAQRARLVLRREGEVVDERVVDLPEGRTVVVFEREATEVGLQRYRLDVEAPQDTVRENNSAFAAVEVEGPGRVLVVEGSPGGAGALTAALRAGGLEVDVTTPAALPPMDTLGTYRSTVLVDVEAESLGAQQVATLGAVVRDLGRGLVTVGGDHSYALGGYRGHELEKLLPVDSEIRDPKRRAKVAQVLAIDNSESMGACHCSPDGQPGFGGPRGGGGGVNKTDISQAAAARAIGALTADDEIGVLAFNDTHRWLIPLQELPPEEVVSKGLAELKPPRGGTTITPSLRAAADGLRKSKARLKHIILFTDGFTNETGLDQEAAKLAEEGITVSVLATGEGPVEDLKKVAEAGRGRFYPGRNLSDIPRIMMQEAVLASRNFVNEGRWFPVVKASSPATDVLTEAPPLLGYVATTTKPTATAQLEIGDEEDPLLASWRVGLGRATSWTSDASARWSQLWAPWGGYTDFWTAVVKDTFPVVGSEAGAVETRIDGDVLRIAATSESGWPDGSTATARVTTPDLQSHVVKLERTAAGSFTSTLPAPGAGTYATGVLVTGAQGQPVFAGTSLATRSYSAEYRPSGLGPQVLEAVASAGAGRVGPDPRQAFDPDDLPPGRGSVPIAGWLLLAAALLWPVDVALRRLVVGQAGPAAVAAAASARRRLPPIPRWSRRTTPAAPEREHPAPARPEEPATPPAVPERTPPPTVQRLLDRKRGVDPPRDQ
ncbi:MAG TPA: VWA domain-containing protein [Actinomycetota bacterium]|nr:VWA domain-containing protein [Actinomycetota bacterium]